MKLFYIAAENDDGDNRDLFVRAFDAKQAHVAWRTYWVGEEIDETLSLRHVFEVPSVAGNIGAVEWGEVPDRLREAKSPQE